MATDAERILSAITEVPFRDVHAATAHVAVQQRGLEACGQALLGLEPQGLF